MLYGAIIDGVNTLTEYGAFVLSPISIGKAELKKTMVDIPGANGSLNYSYVSGGPTYSRRTISFSLGCKGNAIELENIRSDIETRWSGKELKLMLPNDTTKYWHGIFEVGDCAEGGTIACTMLADPFKVT